MKKLFILMFCMIFLVVTVTISAFEFDNVISYTNEDKTAIFENIFGLGEVLGEAELTSHNSVNEIRNVMLGEDRAVMYYKFSKWEIYENGLGEVSFIDMKTGEEVKKDYYFAKAIYKNINVIDYGKDICTEIISPNGTFEECEKNIIESHIEKQFDYWERLEINDIPKEEVTIALITDVLLDEHLDGVWTIAGKKLSRHAQWTDSFNEFIIAGYNFEGVTNVLFDVINGTFNLTENVVGGFPFNISGIIGDGQNFSYGGTPGTPHGNFNASHVPIADLNRNMSFSIWATLNDADADSNPTIFSTGQSGIGLGWSRALTDKVQVFHVGVSVLGTGCDANNGTFTHYGLVVHQNGSVIVYKNGTRCDTFTTGENFADNNGANAGLVSSGGGIATILDEYYIWNRSLSDQEMSDLFNGGEGITFTNNTSPIVSLSIPTNNSNFSVQSVLFNCSAIDNDLVLNDSIANISLIIDDLINVTVSNTTALQRNISLQTNVTSITEGIHNWTCNSTDTSNNQGTTGERLFLIDITAPLINVTNPRGTIDFHVLGTNLTLDYGISDIGLDSCWFEYNLVNTSLNCSATSIEFVTLNNIQNLTVYANDTSGSIGSNFTSWDFKVLELNQTFNNETIEGATENFNIVIKTSGSQVSTANLIYNGTSNTGTTEDLGSNIFSISRDLIISNVASELNVTFFWNITLSDDSNVNSSENNQTIKTISLDNCTANTNQIFNLTVLDEELQTPIANTTIELSVNILSSDRSANVSSISLTSPDNPTQICLNNNLTSSTNFSLDAVFKYEAGDYAIEYYNIENFNLNAASPLQNIELFDLNLSDSTEFKITFKDASFSPVEDALVFINRQYISEDVFKTVEIPKTDSNSETVGHFVRNDVVYNILIVKDGVVIGNFQNIRVFCDDFTIGNCILSLEATAGLTIPFEFDEVSGLIFESEPIFDNETKVMSFTYATTTGSTETVSMTVERNDVFGNRTLCEDSLTSASGTLSCTVSSTIDDTLLVTTINLGNNTALITNTEINRSDFGSIGYLAWFLLSLVLVFVFGDDKTNVFMAMLFSYIGAFSIGLINRTLFSVGAAGTWLIAITIIGIWQLNKSKQQ